MPLTASVKQESRNREFVTDQSLTAAYGSKHVDEGVTFGEWNLAYTCARFAESVLWLPDGGRTATDDIGDG